MIHYNNYIRWVQVCCTSAVYQAILQLCHTTDRYAGTLNNIITKFEVIVYWTAFKTCIVPL